MPRPRFDRLDAETRQRLLEAAAVEFAAHGYERASLNRVIDQAGMSKGSFYYYFDDKADLFATVLKMTWDVCIPEQPLDIAALETATFWPTLAATMAEFSEVARVKEWLPGMARLLYHPPKDEQVKQLVAAEFSRVRAYMWQLVRRGQELGVVRIDLPEGLLLRLVLTVSEAADHWMVDHWEELEPVEVERLAAEVFRVLQRLAAPLESSEPAVRGATR